MKRILMTAAAISIAATGAIAQSGYVENEINSFVPELDVSTLTNEQTAAVMNIISGDGNEAQKEQEIRAYLDIFPSPAVTTTTVVVTPEQAAEIEAAQQTEVETLDTEFHANLINGFLPDVDYSALTDEQRAALVDIANSGTGTDSEKAMKMEAYLNS
jgi:hypothetical protein